MIKFSQKIILAALCIVSGHAIIGMGNSYPIQLLSRISNDTSKTLIVHVYAETIHGKEIFITSFILPAKIQSYPFTPLILSSSQVNMFNFSILNEQDVKVFNDNVNFYDKSKKTYSGKAFRIIEEDNTIKLKQRFI